MSGFEAQSRTRAHVVGGWRKGFARQYLAGRVDERGRYIDSCGCKYTRISDSAVPISAATLENTDTGRRHLLFSYFPPNRKAV